VKITAATDDVVIGYSSMKKKCLLDCQ